MTPIELAKLLIPNRSDSEIVRLIGEINSPRWNSRREVGDWKNYVPLELRSAWGHISEESKVVALAMAENHVANEPN